MSQRRITLSIDEHLIEQARRTAAQQHMSLSTFFATAARSAIRRHDAAAFAWALAEDGDLAAELEGFHQVAETLWDDMGGKPWLRETPMRGAA